MKGHYVVLFPVLTNVKKIIDVYAEYTYEKYIHRMQLFAHWDNHEPTQSWTIPIPESVTKCKKFICDVLQQSGLPHPAYIKFVKTDLGRHAYILLYTNPSAEDRHSIASQFEGHFPLPEDGYRMWKWRTYWHAYTPWVGDVGDGTADGVGDEDVGDGTAEDEEAEGDDTHLSDVETQFAEMSLHDTATDAVDIEKTELERAQSLETAQAPADECETISVYDYIMEETVMNKYHMGETYPLYSEDTPVLSKEESSIKNCVVSLQDLCSALSDIDIQKI